MEQDLRLEILTLQDIEECANKVMWKITPEKKEGIRTKDRVLKDTLLCRYCYYKMAYSIIDPEKENRVDRKTKETIRPNMFTMEKIVKQIEGKNHSNVLHGTRSLDLMIEQKHPLAKARWDDMLHETYEMYLKKEKYERFTKRVLIGRI